MATDWNAAAKAEAIAHAAFFGTPGDAEAIAERLKVSIANINAGYTEYLKGFEPGFQIDPASVEAEYFTDAASIGSRSVLTDEEIADGLTITFGHIVMTDITGRDLFARQMLKGENVDEVIANLKATGTNDGHLCFVRPVVSA